MTYFQFLSLALGLTISFSALLLLWNPSFYQRLWTEQIYPEKKSLWHSFILLGIAALTIVTWQNFFQEMRTASFMICLFLTLGLMKVFLFYSYYEKIRPGCLSIFIKERAARCVIAISGTAVGVVLLIIAANY